MGIHKMVRRHIYIETALMWQLLWLQFLHIIHPVKLLSLQWRHNGREGVSNHKPRHCLFKLLFRRRSKKTPKLRVTGLCVGNSPGTGEFPAQMASNAENVSFDDVIMMATILAHYPASQITVTASNSFKTVLTCVATRMIIPIYRQPNIPAKKTIILSGL